ncbi:hypothetical protein [Rufibacter quisquiliarum]|uniref:Uncharacterized protein n=1 Tax=Rufibacter quisquiliarum TaxID=1549639 RepID=A0A839GNA9_9BACT|nr:hypothetical protein [Rufibacter quisquiliarum]MBA9078299.1 hypothetical protein [Rufibacter quisquiliarum]
MQHIRTIASDYSHEMEVKLKQSLPRYSDKELEVLLEYYQNKRPDLAKGLELVQQEINARKSEQA